MTLKVIHGLQSFSNAIRRTFVQHVTRFQLTVCSHGSSALAELLVIYVRAVKLVFSTVIYVVATKTLNFDPGPEHETDVLIVNFNGPHCGLSTNCATKNELIK